MVGQITDKRRLDYLWYFRTTAVITPAIRNSSCGTIGGYFGLAASKVTFFPFLRKYFIVQLPSTSARIMSPFFGSLPLSTITKSFSFIPSPIMESPVTDRTNDDAG